MEERKGLKMRRTRPTMRRSIDFCQTPYWVFKVNDEMAEALRKKDQAERDSKK